MSKLLELEEKLQDTHAAIARQEAVCAKDSGDRLMAMSLESLYRRKEVLEKRFEEASHEEFLDVCNYRMIAEKRDVFPLASLTKALNDFQEAFAIIYNAIKNGPRERGRIAPEVAQEASFNFAYSYSGSLGFALTIPNDRLIGCRSELDSAMELFFNIVKAQNPDSIKELSEKAGIAAVRKVFNWAKSHTDYATSVDIEWKRASEVRSSLLVQDAELRHLQEIISSTSEEKTDDLQLEGTLVGIDTALKTFHMSFPESEDIKGKISKKFTGGSEFTVPQYCVAAVKKREIIHYSYEKIESNYELLSISTSDD